MARYCFYCGRQLNSGEKCGCRAAGNGGQTAQTGSDNRPGKDTQGANDDARQAKGRQDGSARQPTGQTSRFAAKKVKSSWYQRLVTAFNPWAKTSAHPGTAGSGYKAQQGRPASAGSHKQTGASHFDHRSLLNGLRTAGSYFIRPADRISQAVRSENRTASLLILTLNGIAGGMFLIMATRQQHLRVLFSLNTAIAVGNQSIGTAVFLFFQGFGISLAASLLLFLIYHLALRYIFHHPTGYIKLLHSLSPSVLYFAVFVLAGLLTLGRSPFTAILMGMAGFAVATVAQFLALKQLTGFEDNRSLILICFVMLVFSSILALLLNLSLPILNALLDQTGVI